ncbi:MAG: HNH endonuclease family protein [Gammaproteobacteria bacterium]|nr:HNH endonuclease family protein [Gammaproteobacteria bacterium]MCY4341844.1 HNH endonuclease family protein [Gammaproteobacteria bacterium]
MSNNLRGRAARLATCLPVCAALFLMAVANAEEEDTPEPVKQSSSGICHCPGGQFYRRTTIFTPFATLSECLESGGRKPKRGLGNCPVEEPEEKASEPAEPPVALKPSAAYDRSAFGGWSDDDNDCRNTRHERLLAHSLGAAKLSENGCMVVAGRWNDPYTGGVFTVAQDLDLDHVVPLRWAWERGASAWNGDRRERFLNDPANLLPVSIKANISKGALGPLDWMPPNEDFACEYVLRFSRVIDRYGLELPAGEASSLEALTASTCD